MWANYFIRVGLLVIFGFLWMLSGRGHFVHFKPVFFAYFTSVLALSLGFFFGDWGLKLFGLTTQTPAGVAVAKFSEASLIVVAVLITASLCGENLPSLFIRKGRLLLSLSLGLLAAVGCLLLSILQAASKSHSAASLFSVAPWILLFVVSNGFMEELLFRGLFLGRYELLVGKWLAIISTALAFTLAHMQVRYTPDIVFFLVVLLGLSIAWGWLMQKTQNLWGAALFHAGADLLIILPIFKSLGAL
jgi:membrane protease YdiL (CAAX protease family)